MIFVSMSEEKEEEEEEEEEEKGRTALLVGAQFQNMSVIDSILTIVWHWQWCSDTGQHTEVKHFGEFSYEAHVASIASLTRLSYLLAEPTQRKIWRERIK